jgi:hypothetical protein
VAAADERRRLDLAHLDDFGEGDVEPDSARQPFELGLAGFDRMLGELAAHVGHDEACAGWLRALVYERLWAAPLDGLFVVKFGQSTAYQSLSWFCSGSNS